MPNKGTTLLVFIGLGDQGMRSLSHFASIRTTHHNTTGLDLDVGFVDVDPIKRHRASRWCSENRIVTEHWWKSLHGALSWCKDLLPSLPKKRTGNRTYLSVVFYDASPTHFHIKHFQEIRHADEELRTRGLPSARLFYFGEKPIVPIDEQGHSALFYEEALEKHPHYCNFVERYNPACVALADTLFKDKVLQITKMQFWRCSCIGLEQYIDHTSRLGVSGGAFLDKSIHDLSIAIAILDTVTKHNFNATSLHAGPVYSEYFLPHHLSRQAHERTFRTLTNGMSELSANGDGMIAAEGYAHIKMIYQETGLQPIAISTTCSWIGVPPAERIALGKIAADFQLDEVPIWCDTRTPDGFTPGLRHEETRMFQVDALTAHGTVHYLGNMLTRRGIVPWLRRKKGRSCEFIPCVQRDALQSCFKDVLTDVSMLDRRTRIPPVHTQSQLGQRISIPAHKIAGMVRRTLNTRWNTVVRNDSAGTYLDNLRQYTTASQLILPPHYFTRKIR